MGVGACCQGCSYRSFALARRRQHTLVQSPTTAQATAHLPDTSSWVGGKSTRTILSSRLPGPLGAAGKLCGLHRRRRARKPRPTTTMVAPAPSSAAPRVLPGWPSARSAMLTGMSAIAKCAFVAPLRGVTQGKRAARSNPRVIRDLVSNPPLTPALHHHAHHQLNQPSC